MTPDSQEDGVRKPTTTDLVERVAVYIRDRYGDEMDHTSELLMNEHREEARAIIEEVADAVEESLPLSDYQRLRIRQWLRAQTQEEGR